MTDVEGVTQNADKLKELYQSIQQDQMNKVLYILTMVTTIFIPAQFLTGNASHSTTCSCDTTIAVPNQPQPTKHGRVCLLRCRLVWHEL